MLAGTAVAQGPLLPFMFTAPRLLYLSGFRRHLMQYIMLYHRVYGYVDSCCRMLCDLHELVYTIPLHDV